jgi:glutathione synthase/RimK-type ligase-like ATP-grasp enzyme
MKPIAIHRRIGSFSDRWIEFCVEKEVPYRAVTCYDSRIIEELRECSALLWHFGHGLPTDLLMARDILNAGAAMGMVVFPDHATCWHFDDKIAQKYLLEAIGAPIIPTHVFYDLKTALHWIDGATFPKVFKLRRGSGSRNVRLVKTQAQARLLARTAFSKGFRASGTILGDAWKVGNAWRKRRLGEFIAAVPRRLRNRFLLDQRIGRENGYLYFQDFVPDNRYDTRVTVIGNRAFGFTRDVRPADFRASGSGRLIYDHSRIRKVCVETAFRVAQHIGAQSVAFDFLDDGSEIPRIAEISYGYDAKPVYDCRGFWGPDLDWHEGAVWPEHAIIEDVISRLG